MFTVIVQVKKPKDQTLFEDYLWNVHLRLVKALPGIRAVRVHKVAKARRQESDVYGFIEMYFDNKQAFEMAMNSDEAKKANEDGPNLDQKAGTPVRFDYYCETRDA